jgi:hypothetical protein
VRYGDLDKAIDRLETAAIGDAAEAPAPEMLVRDANRSAALDTGRHLPRFEDVAIRLRKGDLGRLDEECLKAKMTRSQWISALVRNRLNRRAQFIPTDRKRLASIYRILFGIEAHMAKIARSMSRPDAPLDKLPMRLEEVKEFQAEMSSVLNEIRDVLRVSDSYWSERS